MSSPTPTTELRDAGVALLASESDPSSMDLACLDPRLAVAAELEGLRVPGPDEPDAPV